MGTSKPQPDPERDGSTSNQQVHQNVFAYHVPLAGTNASNVYASAPMNANMAHFETPPPPPPAYLVYPAPEGPRQEYAYDAPEYGTSPVDDGRTLGYLALGICFCFVTFGSRWISCRDLDVDEGENYRR